MLLLLLLLMVVQVLLAVSSVDWILRYMRSIQSNSHIALCVLWVKHSCLLRHGA